MKNTILVATDGCVTIDFRDAEINESTLTQRTEEVLPLLHALILADQNFQKLSERDYSERGRAYMAMNMLCQFTVQKAIKQADLLRAIVDGSESISDHGFPEFDGDRVIDV